MFGLSAVTGTGVRAQQSQPGAVAASAAVAPVIPPRPNPSDVMKNWPVYPEALRRTGEQGTVLLQIRVDAGGVPRQIGIARSSNVALLDEAAVRAVSRWRFSPATRGGQPVAATVSLPIDFRLKDPEPASAPGKPAAKAPAQAKPRAPRAQQTERAAPRRTATESPAPQQRQPSDRQGLQAPPSLTLPPPR
ncbi:energy transducer TonB [Chelatococcus asaccharovorans]|uniref:energy transducer TonB n=1 Tax=Chelatococcus asaccharovorans TaxID=28210 RepID=UPI00224C7441|nr:energy transducer TonB [Chelatococcus asaccharovorans]CAH1671577.1 TonB family protein [Chelatococcus asaccharovorans]CAH1676989.1 TonB family protein [Chelatococcus asaccharovorans]